MKPLHNPLHEKSFFRKVSKSLLRRFFDSHNVLRNIAWDGRAEANISDIYDAYTALPGDIKSIIAEDLEEINDLAGQRGMPCMVDAAVPWKVNRADMTPHDLAVTLFLDYRDAFDIAHDWWTIDHFQGYDDFRGDSPLAVSKPEAGKRQLEAAFSEFLSGLERGREVKVEVYKDPNKLAYVVCHEDYMKPEEHFQEHELVVEKRRPVVYATMIYYPNLGKLKVKAEKDEIVQFARDAFAEHILGDMGFFRHVDVRLIYDFDRFKREWRFTLDPKHGIEWVRVVGIRFRPGQGTKDSVEVRSYTNLEQRLTDMQINLGTAAIDHVSMCFKFQGKGRKGSRTVNLGRPNHNNLTDTSNDQIIERYLVQWEIANT